MFVYACPYDDFGENARPQQMMEMLNVYLEVATDVIHHARGIIDKYMGNEIMVLFNTQLNPDANHALLRRRWRRWNCATPSSISIKRLGIDPDPHLYRIGIHTGVATLGNVGSMNRRSFTAIGDTINLSKRLQENAAPGRSSSAKIRSSTSSRHSTQPRSTCALRNAIQFRSRAASRKRASTRFSEPWLMKHRVFTSSGAAVGTGTASPTQAGCRTA